MIIIFKLQAYRYAVIFMILILIIFRKMIMIYFF